jgi:hypothetical protein
MRRAGDARLSPRRHGGPAPPWRRPGLKFLASFFQERRIFFSEEKKQKTFDYDGMTFPILFEIFLISIGLVGGPRLCFLVTALSWRRRVECF